MTVKAEGFTLIEIIVTIVIVAVMGTMIYTYFGNAFSESVTPVVRLQKTTDLHGVMEKIKAAYNVYPKWRSGTAYAANDKVVPANPNGHYYTCKAGGSCGASAPETDGGINWTDSGRVRTLLSLDALKTRIGAESADQDNVYGKYYVVTNRFVRFVSDVEQDDTSGTNNILKVTIRNNTEDTAKYKLGGTLTALFISD